MSRNGGRGRVWGRRNGSWLLLIGAPAAAERLTGDGWSSRGIYSIGPSAMAGTLDHLACVARILVLQGVAAGLSMWLLAQDPSSPSLDTDELEF